MLVPKEEENQQMKDENSLAARIIPALRFPGKDFVKSSVIFE